MRKLEEVAGAMRRVERESREIWREEEEDDDDNDDDDDDDEVEAERQEGNEEDEDDGGGDELGVDRNGDGTESRGVHQNNRDGMHKEM